MISMNTTPVRSTFTVVLLGALAASSAPAVAGHKPTHGNADDRGKDMRNINCASPHSSVQAVIDKMRHRRALSIVIQGTCTEKITITTDDLTLMGHASGGTIDGSVHIVGARRVTLTNLKVTGAGSGVVGEGNASFTVDSSEIDANDGDGVVVSSGASASLKDNRITNNGQAATVSTLGHGVQVVGGASANITDNVISDNRSDGVGVFNDSYARLESNLIERNGRANVFEAGVQVARARVRASGNQYRDNGYAAIVVYNDGNYRTGDFLSSTDAPNNALPFEIIEQGAGSVAVELGQMSFVDLRQVQITGSVTVGHKSMLQIRGDNVGPDLRCSNIDGDLSVGGLSALARLRNTNVNGTVFVGNDALLNGQTVCQPL